MRNLTKGNYQVQFKKYSSGFDVYDFTLRVYADKLIRLIDDEDQKITNVELSKEVMDKIQNITDHRQIQKVLDDEKNSEKIKLKVPPKVPSKTKPEGAEPLYEPAGNPQYKKPEDGAPAPGDQAKNQTQPVQDQPAD